MYSLQQHSAHTAHRAGAHPAQRRGGAALIVVISLLGALAFLGFLFYSFAAQEVASAEYFSQSETPDVPLPPDVFWDWSLQQLIVGTDAGLTNSALYGNKYSLLANMLGSPNVDLSWGAYPPGGPFTSLGDVQPFDGAGISTVVGALNPGPNPEDKLQFGFDIDQDGVFDLASEPTWQNFIFNFSPAADSPFSPGPYSQNGTPFSGSAAYRDYEPDAGYTYPDINSPFLAYDAVVRGWIESSATPRNFRVVIPSFFRPQLFPTRRGNNDTVTPHPNGTNGNGFGDLYIDPATARQVLRPHAAHIASFAPLVLRFATPLDPNAVDDDGDMIADFVQAQSGDTTREIGFFPFTVDVDGDHEDGNNNGVLDPGEDQNGNGVLDVGANEMGVWTNPLQGQIFPVTAFGPNYEFDVDADGDGIRDAIWLDLDFPLMTLDDGRQFVPMFAIKMIDADALLNVNAHGNANGLYVRMQDGTIEVLGGDGMPIVGSTTGVFGVDGLSEIISFHQSNQGLSPSEVNLSLALTANLRDPSHIDPRAAAPLSSVDIDDVIATQFELMWNFNYSVDPGLDPPFDPPSYPPTPPPIPLPYPPAYTNTAPTNEAHAPSQAALSNLEALMILNGRRQFEKLRDGTVRETRQQILGRHGDRFKISEFYRRLAFFDDNYPNGLTGGPTAAGGDVLPSPLPGGFNLDDDGNSNQPGLAPFFGGNGDDDVDSPGVQTGNFRLGGGSYFFDQDLFGVQMPPAVHPLDFLGAGSGIYDRTPAASEYLTRQLGQGMAYANPNPSVFPTYLDPVASTLAPPLPPLKYWHHNEYPDGTNDFDGDSFNDVDRSGVLPWRLGLNPAAATPGNLDENNSLYDFLIDEASEVILEPEFRNPEYDSVFPTYEMEALQLSRADASKIKVGSRLQQLASINLRRARESVTSQIRKLLATDSWDRMEPGQTRFRGVSGPAFRNWEYNIWNAGDLSAGDFYTAGEAFPPEFGDGAGGRTLAGTAEDPIRPELRLLLKNERGFSGSITGDVRYPRHQININRLLAGEYSTAPPPNTVDRRAFDDDSNPRFRNLTPHPNVTQLINQYGAIDATNISIPAMVHDNVGVSTQPGIAPLFDNLGLDPSVSQADRETLVETQEWWARYDRQRLARDIYTLLYTLANGDDSLDPTSQASATVYDPTNPNVNANSINDNLEAMAQFAVNYVDALDHDNVITRFEYDTDLSDGWQWAAGGAYVNGVEAQQLTFSEAIWVKAPEQTSDHTETNWDDTAREHQFLHIELRSTTPFPVELDDETWRIVRVETDGTRTGRMHFRSNGGTNLSVPPGEVFTIGTNDGHVSNQDHADLYLDMTPIIPQGPAADPASALPLTNLDLINTSDPNNSAFQVVEVDSTLDATRGNNMSGTLVGIPDAANTVDPIQSFDLVLERRRHLNAEDRLGQIDDSLNAAAVDRPDWIEVDRMRVWAQPYDRDASGAAAGLNALKASLRLEPLCAPSDITDQTNSETDSAASINHTIFDTTNLNRHQANVKTPGTDTPATEFSLWQPHFDRDFSSIFELLAVPLCGPELLTQRLAFDEIANDHDPSMPRNASWPQVTGEYYDAIAALARASLAGRFFMNTDPLGDTDPVAGTGLEDDNRWYRLLEYLQVPNRAEEAIRERLPQIVRTPGKLNLNTIRHEQVFAALIDDLFIERFVDPDRMTDSDAGLEPPAGGFRNWIDELRLARDGIDPINYFSTTPDDRTYLPLPGIPGVIGDPSDITPTEFAASGRPQFGAQPFRSLSYLDPYRYVSVATNGGAPYDTIVPPTAHTILRNHVFDVGYAPTADVLNRRGSLSDLGLLEARPTTDLGTEAYDYHTRNRLLAKVANNSTERSNVFACWIVVEFFEAHQPLPVSNPEIVQVGAKLEGSPTHRGFFIIDRTRLERAVDQDSVTNSGNGDGRDDNFRFDWRDFVIHRRTIQ